MIVFEVHNWDRVISSLISDAEDYWSAVSSFDEPNEQMYYHDIFVARLETLLECSLISYESYNDIYHYFASIAYKPRSNEFYAEWIKNLRSRLAFGMVYKLKEV